MHRFLFTFFMVLVSLSTFAQELNFRVNVSAARLQTTDPKIFKTLQDELNNFLNDRKWTEDTFTEEERLEGSININITDELSTDRYRAQVSIQVNRPTYNSDYKTALFNYNDRNLEFQYQEFQSLEFNDNDYLLELTSFMAFYAYISLGLYYDSMGAEAGTPYFLKAQTVVNNAQNNSSNAAWKAFSKSNQSRYWMIENILNNRYKGMRQVSIHQEKANLMIMQLWFNAKSNEIVKIMKEASPIEKTKVVNILSKLDPSNINRYQQILGR